MPTKPKDPLDFTAALEALQARIKALEAGPPLPQLAYSRKDFCKIHDISPTLFHKLQKQGRGPRLMYVGAQARISVEDAAEWRKKRAEDDASKEAQLEHARLKRAARAAAEAAVQSPLHVSKKKKRG